MHIAVTVLCRLQVDSIAGRVCLRQRRKVDQMVNSPLTSEYIHLCCITDSIAHMNFYRTMKYPVSVMPLSDRVTQSHSR